MNKLKAVLFDLDGTLVDSERFYYDCWVPVLYQHFALDLTIGDWMKYFVGHTLPHNVQTLKDVWEIDTSADFLLKHITVEYEKANMSNISLMSGAKELVSSLHKNGLHLAVVTSSHYPTVETVLGKHDMLPYFDFFVTRENVTFPKPHPEPYLLAKGNWNFEDSEILVIEDSYVGATAAKEARLSCFVVNPFEPERVRLDFVDGLFYNLNEISKELGTRYQLDMILGNEVAL